ncbi:lipopolysaccharide biosynthesis protein [Cellulomonas sp. ATA003]|uniref:lipopolysaccharide biosynthesis protein n=1 Tax=Cellulomonas sp. ATA003 TaxID=3073064 RepID=UPI002873B713|nr:lipopolysaccharide biosynthesis protein [Cellulomonas sp. ATA003]WNB85423.1 lipopolysaccharide biosynthesis protein [Cellulomonas sp. ATA003]
MTPEADDDSPAQPSSLRQQAVSGVVWTTLEKWSVRLSTLVGFIILGNLLTPLQFGVVALATTFISFLTTVADGGFASYLLQKQRLTPAVTNTAFYLTSALALMLALVVAALAGPASGWLDTPQLREVLPALAVALLIAGVSTVPAVLLARDLRFKELALRQILAALLSVAAAIGLALAGAGVWALVGQTLVRGVVSFAALWWASDFRPRLTFDRSEIRPMVAYGSKSLLVLLAPQARTQGEVFIIGALVNAVAVGYWTVAGRLVNVVVDVISSVVGSVAHPVFARLQEAPERLGRALATARALSALVLVPSLVALALVSEDVVPAVFGDQWAPTTTVASVLALSALLQAVTDFDRSVLLATGHPGAELKVVLIFVVVHLGVVFVFHSDLEVLAAAIGATVALSVPVRMLVVRHLLGVPSAQPLGRPACSSPAVWPPEPSSAPRRCSSSTAWRTSHSRSGSVVSSTRSRPWSWHAP